jgi:hypothetical protein
MEYPIFQYVAEDSWDALISLSREIYMECLPMETEVINQGDDPETAYLMVQGRAQVTLTMTFVTKFNKTKTKTVSYSVLIMFRETNERHP